MDVRGCEAGTSMSVEAGLGVDVMGSGVFCDVCKWADTFWRLMGGRRSRWFVSFHTLQVSPLALYLPPTHTRGHAHPNIH